MAVGTRYKDPDSKRKYTIDWTRWLASQSPGEVISNSVWVVPTGLTQLDAGATSYKTTIWLTSGTDGARYDVINRITTSAGQIQDATIEIIMAHQ
jgi:hypothetical protein